MLLKIKNKPNKHTNQFFILKYKNERDSTFYDTEAIFIGLYDNPITNRCEYCFLIDKKYFKEKRGFISDCGVGETNDWIYLSDFPINRNFKKIVLEYITPKKAINFLSG